jgi:CMP-2-keto-3-deoxyoctulosonic acid synthetase
LLAAREFIAWRTTPVNLNLLGVIAVCVVGLAEAVALTEHRSIGVHTPEDLERVRSLLGEA